jgi:large subunit ribosomal protein L6
MSRLGKLPIQLINGVEAIWQDGCLTIKGPKGQLKQIVPPIINLIIENNQIILSISGDSKKERSFWGLFRALINNMVIGVSSGFEKKLEIIGVGYRVAVEGNILKLNLGFSHPINFELPKEVEAKVEGNIITLSSINKKLLGDTAYKIRKFRPPEPYKGKGVKYIDEVIKRKVGKTAGKETK